MNAYDRTWAEFLAAGELADHWRDWIAWAGPRSTHLVFLVRVGGDRRIAARVAEVQAALKQAGGLDLHPRRFLHLSVQALGFLAREGVVTPEHISPPDVLLAVEQVREALAGQPAFGVYVGGTNSFYSSAFLEVHDDGALGALRRRIQAALPRVGAIDSWPDYIFHLTVAYYRGGDHHAVQRALEGLRQLPPLQFQVRELELLLLHAEGDQLFPPMVRLARFPLRLLKARGGGGLEVEG
ncbi:MAG: 2'-5' RNA ligase family protein [Chloroflexi bacterium]|nr:2'-5' RNA ligase family protein [Chloroflexota bacterium]